MQVRCVKVAHPVTGEPLEGSPWLRVGETYLVLSVLARHGSNLLLQLDIDAQGPAWFAADLFVTTSEVVPRNWSCRLREEGVMELAPEPWLEPGFWEDFFDGTPGAVRAFESQRDEIRRAHQV